MSLTLLVASRRQEPQRLTWTLTSWPERKFDLSNCRRELLEKLGGRDCSERSSIRHRSTSVHRRNSLHLLPKDETESEASRSHDCVCLRGVIDGWDLRFFSYLSDVASSGPYLQITWTRQADGSKMTVRGPILVGRQLRAWYRAWFLLAWFTFSWVIGLTWWVKFKGPTILLIFYGFSYPGSQFIMNLWPISEGGLFPWFLCSILLSLLSLTHSYPLLLGPLSLPI